MTHRVNFKRSKFIVAFGIRLALKYDKFILKVQREIDLALDASTDLDNLQISRCYRGVSGNVHSSLIGDISRRGENGELGGEIIWLNNLRTFRGRFWTTFNPEAEFDHYMASRELFRAGKYQEFVDAWKLVGETYRENKVGEKMLEISYRRMGT